MTMDKVMLLIDADNVSLDVIEQAVGWVGKHFGGPHVRRAYCTAESAVKHQTAFKRLSIRPMVNLAAGKNSTDIALAVDAIDLTLAERPDVVVIASSDSDFAPLVSRLREKGCRVIGIGQQGKTGDETRAVYDDYEVMEHHRAKPQGRGPGRGEGRNEVRKEVRAEGRNEGRADGRGDGRGEGRGEGRARGRAGRKTAVPAQTLPVLEDAVLARTLPSLVLEAPTEPVEPRQSREPREPQAPAVAAVSEKPVERQAAAEAAPAQTGPSAEARPARARSRGGRRKPVPEGAPGSVAAAKPARERPAAKAALAAVPAAPQAAPAPSETAGLPAALPAADVKPARKPRRRRPAAAKRPADAGPGSLP